MSAKKDTTTAKKENVNPFAGLIAKGKGESTKLDLVNGFKIIPNSDDSLTEAQQSSLRGDCRKALVSCVLNNISGIAVKRNTDKGLEYELVKTVDTKEVQTLYDNDEIKTLIVNGVIFKDLGGNSKNLVAKYPSHCLGKKELTI